MLIGPPATTTTFERDGTADATACDAFVVVVVVVVAAIERLRAAGGRGGFRDGRLTPLSLLMGGICCCFCLGIVGIVVPVAVAVADDVAVVNVIGVGVVVDVVLGLLLAGGTAME